MAWRHPERETARDGLDQRTNWIRICKLMAVLTVAMDDVVSGAATVGLTQRLHTYRIRKLSITQIISTLAQVGAYPTPALVYNTH